MVHSIPNCRWGRFFLIELSHYTVETVRTHTYMDAARLSYSIFYFSTVTEKMLRNSTIAFPFFCLPLPFHPDSFSQLRNFTNSSHTCKGWRSREGPAKTILQLEREGEMAFVYILLLRSKNIFQSLKPLEGRTHQAFYNSVFKSLFFYLCTVYLGTLAGSF